MAEFLTENARLAYPLEHEWPDGFPSSWTRVLLDACVGYDGVPDMRERVCLVSVEKGDGFLLFDVGPVGTGRRTRRAVVRVEAGGEGYRTAYGEGPGVKAFLTVDCRAVAAVMAAEDIAPGLHVVGVPFAMRCTSFATRFVDRIEVYAAGRHEKPVFDPEAAVPVRVLEGAGTDAVLASGDGVDIETTVIDPSEGELLRVSVITAEKEAGTDDRPVDMMIRGDACVVVEALPDVVVGPGGAPVPSPEDERGKHGVIRIGQRCKPCCQCEDYKDAVDRLRPGEDATGDVEAMLNDAKSEYDAAMTLFEEVKAAALAAVNSYPNVQATAIAVSSGGVYTKSQLAGSRCRIAVNLTVVNRTRVTARVSEVEFVVPGFGDAPVKVSWNTAGSRPRAGSSLTGVSWSLEPGDTLAVVATYAKAGVTNTAVKPSGMTARFTAKLPGKDPYPRELEVK